MEKDQLSRKLAVILHADVVGSTALVQQNEMLAHERIQSAFNNFSKIISSHAGTAHEIRGDALVAEFDRASDAVTAALAFQQANEETNQALSGEIRPRLRIGISLGEVIVADKTITGAGVVLAQRLEQLSEPGGVVVQGSVSETVPVRLPFNFESLGEHELKGFDHPVRAFAATSRNSEELSEPDEKLDPVNGRVEIPETPTGLTSEVFETLTGDRLELPSKPSIAVLPFVNMSGDPEQEVFADGMTEDIITGLSRVGDLVVISRSSTFVYKGRAVDVRQVGDELVVSHVLEGSVRKAGDNLRITAQLVKTQGGEHIWAENYDRKISDIFAIQDEITRNIVVELCVELVDGEAARALAGGTDNIKAWELVRHAGTLLDSHTQFNIEEAKRLASQALEFDNNYSAAWVTLGWIYWVESSRKWGNDPEELMQKALDAAQSGVDADPDYPMAYSLLAHVHMSLGDTEQAIAIGEKAISLGPNDSYALAIHADRLIESGQVDEGLRRLKKAIRLCPFPPAWFLLLVGTGYHLKGENDAAVYALKLAIERQSDSHLMHAWLASALVDLGRLEEAQAASRRVLDLEPSFSAGSWSKTFNSEAHLRIRDNLLTAGLPE